MQFVSLSLCILSVACTVAAETGAHLLRVEGSRAVRKHISSLRVCNAAFASAGKTEALLVRLGGKDLVTGGVPQGDCKDIPASTVGVGDMVELRLGDANGIGQGYTPEVRELQDEPILYLTAYVMGSGKQEILAVKSFYGRHDGLDSAQVAFIDAFDGGPASVLSMTGGPAGTPRPMKSGDVLHVHPGQYSAAITSSGEATSSSSVVALRGESYVVVRTAKGAALVFPKSDPSLLSTKSSAEGLQPAGLVSFALGLLLLKLWA